MARGDALETAKRFRFYDFSAGMYFERVEIGANELDRGRVGFYEDRFFRAAADGFNADCSGTGVEVDEKRVLDRRAQNIEKRFAQAIAGGAQAQFPRAFEQPASKCSGDHAHESFRFCYPTDAS